MADKTKGELIEEAKEKGVELTGDETTADLIKKLLKEEDPEPVAEPELHPDTHFFVEGDSTPRLFPDPKDIRPRRMFVDGKNAEHVHDHESGCWVYRFMA